MRQKAVLIEFRGITNINAETVVSRHFDLKAVHETLITVPDIYTWKIPNEHIRPTQAWSIEWGPEQDSKLVVGIWKYGVGSWEAMLADPGLSFTGKFFLEDIHKSASRTPASLQAQLAQAPPPPPPEGMEGMDGASTAAAAAAKQRLIPNAVHLVRRGDYLCGLIREFMELAKSYAEQQYGPGRIAPPHGSVAAPRPPEAGPSKRIKLVSSSKNIVVDNNSEEARAKRKPTPVYTDSSSDE